MPDKKYIVLLLILFLFIFANVTYAKNSITVTAVDVEDNRASVTINDCIKIDEILIIEGDNKKFIKFPEYISKSGRVYPQVVILKKDISEKIEEAVISGISVEKETDKLKYKITKLFMLSGKSRRANVEVIFNDVLRITCGVIETRGNLWVAWPSRKDAKGWIKQVRFLMPEFKKMLDSEILIKYRAAVSEEPD